MNITELLSQVDWSQVGIAVLVLGVTGALFGLLLAIASRAFAVKKDQRVDQILELLPGANCGGCGFAGCAAYADALVAGSAQVGACSACSAEATQQIAQILGVTVGENIRMTALVRCSGGHRTTRRYTYLGIQDCASAARLGGGPLDCAYGCLGLGSCVSACPFGAIYIDPELGVARVRHEQCTGCMACARACPKGLIVPVPYYADVTVMCASKERGATLRKYCQIGCLGCHLCEKACPHDAIHVVDNLAQIDYAKCVGCGKCAEKCPRHLIVDTHLSEKMQAAGLMDSISQPQAK